MKTSLNPMWSGMATRWFFNFLCLKPIKMELRTEFPFFAQCFRQEWAFQSFGVCTLHTKTEIIAWPRVVGLKTQEHETVVWGMFGIYFFPWFLAKSQMCICTEVKKIFKKGVPVKKVYWILFRNELRRRLFKINYQNWKRFTKNKYFLCAWKSSMVNMNAKKPCLIFVRKSTI